MNYNLTNQQSSQPLPSKKKCISPWTLGIISVLLALFGIYVPDFSRLIIEYGIGISFSSSSKFGAILAVLYYAVVLVFAFFGLIRGLKELKLERKKSVILGLILSLKNIHSQTLGGVSILLALFGISFPFIVGYFSWLIIEYSSGISFSSSSKFGALLVVIYYTGVFVLALFGLIKGILELRLPRKKPAIIGIILCLIGLTLSVILGYGTVLIFALGAD